MTNISLQNFFTPEQVREIVAEKKGQRYKKEVIDYFRQNFKKGFLKFNAKDLGNHHNYAVNFLYWIFSESDEIPDNIQYSVAPDLFANMISNFTENNKLTDWNQIFEKFDVTDWNQREISLSIDAHCQGCGGLLKIIFSQNKWSIEQTHYASDDYLHPITNKDNCFENKEFTYNLNFPTGEVLAFDWFAHEMFNSLNYFNNGDFASNAGKMRLTEGAIKNGFVRVFASDSDVFVVPVENGLAGLQYQRHNLPDVNQSYSSFYDNLPNKIIQVTTSMHNVVLIDKAVLLDLIDRFSDTKEDSDKAFRNVIDSTRNSLTIEPGIYTLKVKQGEAIKNCKGFDSLNTKTIFSLTKV